VKLIYIDPPYNTGNESWVYNDNVSSPEIKEWLGKVVGKEAEDLSRHDKWLCMMYPRLMLLKRLLADDGVILVSIDNNEVSHLRLMMDEVFGAHSFLAEVVWQKVYSPRMDAKSFSADHDYLLVYAHSKFSLGKVPFEQNAKQFSFFDETTNQPYRRRSLRKEGKNSRKIDRPNLYYSLIAPDGSEVFPVRPDGSDGNWRWSYQRYEKNKRLFEWIKTEDNGWQIYVRQYLDENAKRPPSTLWFHEDVGHNHEANDELKRMFGELVFDSPKPTRLIKQIIQITTQSEDLILDSFAGSGTTGHAALKFSKEMGSRRRFILVEMEEKIAKNVTSQRLQKAIEGYSWKRQRGKVTEVEGVGDGFRYCTLDAPLFNAEGQIREEVSCEELARHVFFTETGEPLQSQNSEVSKTSEFSSPLLGISNKRAIYLLFNGILGDKNPKNGNILTRKILSQLPKHEGAKVIYGEGCLLSEAMLRETNITFRQLPYEIKIN